MDVVGLRRKESWSTPPTGAETDGSDFSDWRWQVRHAITTLDELSRRVRLTEEEEQGVQRAMARGFPMSITPYYLSLLDPFDPACPIRRQCVPLALEAHEVRGDLKDPLGEEAHEVAPHVVQRYPDRALLLATDTCSVYCRFCTRSRMVGAAAGAVSVEKLEPAFEYLRAHPEIRDVILSGGDPLVMSTARVSAILRRLAEIESIGTVRVATRTPVTLPQRITSELCAALREHPSVWLMTHFNHPKELSVEARQACARLVDAGIPVMNQSVLLRGINDSVEVLEALFRELIRIRVRPYYLLQADPVRGTAHLRTPLQKGIELITALQGRMSGIAVPKLIVDTAGGRGKVNLAPSQPHLRDNRLVTFRGEEVEHIDPP